MRSTKGANRKGKTLALFVDDTFGGSIIQCYVCNHQQEDRSEFGTVTRCEGCGKELLYPEWASW